MEQPQTRESPGSSLGRLLFPLPVGQTGPGQQDSLPSNSGEGRLLCGVWEQDFGPQGGRRGGLCAACCEKGEGDKGQGLLVPQQITRADGSLQGKPQVREVWCSPASAKESACLGDSPCSALTPFPFPREPLSPSNPFSSLYLLSSPQCSPRRAEGELSHLTSRAQSRGCAQGTFRGRGNTCCVPSVHGRFQGSEQNAPGFLAPNPPPRPFSLPKGQWRPDINNPVGSAHGYPACPHRCLASPSAQLRPARHNV